MSNWENNVSLEQSKPANMYMLHAYTYPDYCKGPSM